MKRLNKKGFTLIELIMVIVIIAILAIVAIPKYLDVQEKAKIASMKGVVGAVRSGIHIFRASSIDEATKAAWPTALDDAIENDTTGLFEEVLDTPVEDGSWKKGATTDHYTCTAVTTGNEWYYHSGSGKFNKTAPE